jgi:SSS family solute:Na+ symporter
MSTADISILTASANMTRDVYQRYINPDVNKRRLLKISMANSVVVGLLAAFLAWRMQDILDTLLLAFTLNSAALFLPTVAAVYSWRIDSRVAFWSMSLSLSSVVVWYLGAALELADLFTIDPLWPGLMVSIVTFVLLNAVGRSRRSSLYPR